MSLYYEITFTENNELAHYVIHDVNRAAKFHRLEIVAHRIWREDNESVTFIKNRFTDIYDTCGYLSKEELDEFVWIKLKSKAV